MGPALWGSKREMQSVRADKRIETAPDKMGINADGGERGL